MNQSCFRLFHAKIQLAETLLNPLLLLRILDRLSGSQRLLVRVDCAGEVSKGRVHARDDAQRGSGIVSASHSPKQRKGFCQTMESFEELAGIPVYVAQPPQGKSFAPLLSTLDRGSVVFFKALSCVFQIALRLVHPSD